MNAFPHVYTTTAQGASENFLDLSSEGLPSMLVSPPPQFGGPEGYWNPEAFFSAAISTCYILTFRSITRIMKLYWININVDVDAYLDKKDSKLSFDKVEIFVTLTLPEGQESAPALKALEKAKENCLITNSINSQIVLNLKIEHQG